MKAGDILFVRGHSPISKVVTHFDKGEFSHVAIALSETHILEAQYFTRSRIVPMYFDDYEVVDLGLTEEQRVQVLKTSINLVGKWYDYIQVIGYLFKHKFNNPNFLICSELIANILFQLGLEKDFSNYKDVTPNELYKLLKAPK